MFLRTRFIVCLHFFLFAATGVGVGQDFSSSNLPIVVITSGSGIWDEPKTYAHMGIIDNGSGSRNNITDPFNNYDGYVGIEVRGSSSQSFPKPQYGIELWTKDANDTSASLMGLPEEEDWILFAPYNDKSLMRDALAYKMGRDMDRYAPRTRFCELVLNGEYRGIYVLIEKIKRDNHRVNISKLEPDETSGDDLTGGYILKLDKFTGEIGSGFASRYKPEHNPSVQVFFQYDYPEPEVITFEQQNYIRNYVNDFESVLMSSDYDDPFQGYRAYVDVESFVDFMIMNEVSKNVDGYRLSTYMHKDKNSKGGKLVMGPIWDFNLGYGNANYCTSGEPEGFVYEFNSICPDDFWLVPFWWKRLLLDTEYRRVLQARWKELRATRFSTENIHAYIDSVASVLSEESQQRNFSKWPVLNQWIWPNLYMGSTYEEEVNILKGWVGQRMQWLDSRWGDNLVTGFEDSATGISVYPNPATKDWAVQFAEGHPEKLTIEVFDLNGKNVYRSEALHDELHVIPAHGLADGLYILKIIRDNNVVQKKLILDAGH
jgi:hypothetical protein